MNANTFSDAMGEINEKYINEVFNFKKRSKKPIWISWGAMAACLCLVVAGVFWGANRQPAHQIALQYNEVSSVMSNAAPEISKGVTVKTDHAEVSGLLGYNIDDTIPSTMKSYDYKYTVIQNTDANEVLGTIIEGRERGDSTTRPGVWIEVSFGGAKPMIDYDYDYETLINSTANGVEVCATVVPEKTYTNAAGEEKTRPAVYTAAFELGDDFYYIESRGALDQTAFDELVCTLIEAATSE